MFLLWPGANEPISVDGTRPVGAQVNMLHLADQSLLDVVHTHAVTKSGCGLGSKLGPDPCLARCLCESTDLCDIVTQRLLTINMPACPHSGACDGEVHVVRDGDIDRIDFVPFFFKQFPPVSVCARLRNLLGNTVQVIAVDITDCDHLGLGVGFEILEVIITHHSPNPDTGMLDLAVGIGGVADRWQCSEGCGACFDE